jgi:hypothetical protein
MTDAQLLAAQEEFVRAEQARELARVKRNNAVIDALENDTKAVEVARITGLGKERVRQLKQAGRQELPA